MYQLDKITQITQYNLHGQVTLARNTSVRLKGLISMSALS